MALANTIAAKILDASADAKALLLADDNAAILTGLLTGLPTSEPVAIGTPWLDGTHLALAAGIPPTITDQPGSITDGVVGEQYTFTITATNATSYQWQLDSGAGFANIDGATSSSYTTPVVGYPYSGYEYKCVATGPGGSTASNAATLTVPAPAMPSGALGIWYAADYETTYKSIPNAAVSPSTNKLITRHPRGAFATGVVGGTPAGGWLSTGVTVTEKYAAGRDGVVAATRIVIATTGQVRYRSTISLPAGTYTMVIDVKTTGAGPQDFLMSRDGGSTTVTKTATSTMQQFKNEFTLASTTTVDLRFLATVAAVAGDFVVDKAFLWDGATGTVPADLTLVGDMYFGNSSKATVGISGGVIALTDGSIGSCDFGAFTTFSECTIFAVVKRTATYDNIAGFRYPFLWDVLEGATAGQGLASLALGEYEAEGGLTGVFAGKRSQPAAGGFSPNMYTDGQYHVISMSANSAEVNLWIDDVEAAINSNGTSTTRTSRKFQIGNTTAAFGLIKFSMNAVAIYATKLSDAQRRVAINSLIAKAQESGITITKPANQLVAYGDSITAGPSSNSYAQQYLANITGGKIVRAQNESIGGSMVTGNVTPALNLDIRLPYHLTGIPALTSERAGRKFIATILIGANDLQPVYHSASSFLTQLWIVTDQLRARGAYVGIGTILPKGSSQSGYAEHNTLRATANASIAAAVGTHLDFVIDFAADATMGPDAAANNATYYGDGLHPTAAGHTILEAIYRAAVNALLV